MKEGRHTVVRRPDLVPETARLCGEFEKAGCSFIEIAEYVCHALNLTEFYLRNWKAKAKNQFQTLDPKTRQAVGAAIGVLTKSD